MTGLVSNLYRKKDSAYRGDRPFCHLYLGYPPFFWRRYLDYCLVGLYLQNYLMLFYRVAFRHPPFYYLALCYPLAEVRQSELIDHISTLHLF